MILVQPLSAPRAANALEVEQRCYLIIVAIFLAQAICGVSLLCMESGAHLDCGALKKSLDPPSITDTESKEVLINTSPGRLDRVTGG